MNTLSASDPNRAHHLGWILRVVSVIILTAVFCMACSRDSNFEQIRVRISDAAGLAEAHDVGKLMELATEDVRAMPMNLNRRGIKSLLWQVFRRYGSFVVLYPRPTIEVFEDTRQASTQFPFLILQKEIALPGLDELREDPLSWAEAVGDQADLYRLELKWVKQDGDWLVDQAVLERFGS